MADLKKEFGDSFNLITHHRSIIMPTLCSILLPLILVTLFLNLSGINPLIKEVFTLYNGYEGEKVNYLLNPQSHYYPEFSNYLQAKGYSFTKFMQLLNISNMVMLVGFLAIGMICSLYFSCMSYAIITLNIKNQKSDFNKLLTVTHKFLLKLFSLKFLIAFIILTPLLIIAAIAISLFFINIIAGAFSAIFFILLFLGYVVFMGLRLFFTVPAMYVEEQGAIKSIKHSFHLTKGHLAQVLIIFTIIYGINLFINSSLSQPMGNTFSNFLFEENILKAVVNLVILCVFVFIEAFALAFENIFLFYAYIDFKELGDMIK